MDAASPARSSSSSTAGGSRRRARATRSRWPTRRSSTTLWARYPHTQLTACGRAVGLPDGQMGNSEVGHLNLGAGAVVKQDLTRIDEAVADGSLAENAVLRAAMRGRRARPPDRPRLRRRRALGPRAPRGADPHGARTSASRTSSSTRSPTGATRRRRAASGFLARSRAGARDAGNARVGSVIGRYFAMDRDKRWERTQLAYDLLVARHGRARRPPRGATPRAPPTSATRPTSSSPRRRSATRRGSAPRRLGHRASTSAPTGCASSRCALAEPSFTDVDRGGAEPVDRYTTLTEYEEGWPYPVAFPPARPENTLPKVIAATGGRQLHVAETEKYPHVTYFFGGGDEDPEQGERRELVPSPRDVPTYDHKPEMSAREARRRVRRRLARGRLPRSGS